jgi:hypothetical protein
MKTGPIWIFCALLLLALILSLPLLINPALKTRSDAVIHIGITRAIMREGIPPSNPFLAGERLPYYWFYNALTALASVTTGADPGRIMIILNILAILIMLLLVFKITDSFTGTSNNSFLAAGLFVFGLNGWGWLLLLPGLSSNGLSTIPPLLTSGIWGFLERIVLTRWEGTMGFMLTKFWVANSFSIGIVAATSAIYWFFRYIYRCRPGSLIAFIFLTLISAHLNIIAGGALIIICFSFFLLQLTLLTGKKSSNKKPILIGIILLGLIAPILIPYLRSIMAETAQVNPVIRFSLPDWFQLRVLAVILAPLWVLAAITFRIKSDERPRTYQHFLLLALLILSAGFLFFRFPKHNEYKLIFLIALFLSLLIGLNSRLTSRKTAWLVWGILLTTIPTTGLGLIAYSYSPDEHPITPDETAIYTWINRNLPADTILIAEKQDELIPLLADRDAYLSCYTFLKSTPINRSLLSQRRNLIRKSGKEKGVAEVLIEISRETGRPVSLIRYSGSLPPDSPLLLHTEGEIEIWGVNPQP